MVLQCTLALNTLNLDIPLPTNSLPCHTATQSICSSGLPTPYLIWSTNEVILAVISVSVLPQRGSSIISGHIASAPLFAAMRSDKIFVWVFRPTTKTVVLSETKIGTRLRPRLINPKPQTLTRGPKPLWKCSITLQLLLLLLQRQLLLLPLPPGSLKLSTVSYPELVRETQNPPSSSQVRYRT